MINKMSCHSCTDYGGRQMWHYTRQNMA